MATISSTIRLNDGVDMPLFGLGMYLNEPGSSSSNAVSCALKTGYKLIDTAIYYKNEEDVGKGICESGIDRKNVFIVDKIRDHGYDVTVEAVKDSLKKWVTSCLCDVTDLFKTYWTGHGL